MGREIKAENTRRREKKRRTHAKIKKKERGKIKRKVVGMVGSEVENKKYGGGEARKIEKYTKRDEKARIGAKERKGW